MRRFPLNSITFLGLAMSFGLVACPSDSGDEGMADGTEAEAEAEVGDGDGDENGDGDPTSGDGDGDPGCYPAPDECLRFINCIGALAPDQLPTVEEQFGEGGACWCSGDAMAQECYATCVMQLETAIMNSPTVAECHENYCTLDELDPAQPYGPITNGSCPDWNGQPQMPIQGPFGIAGGFCSPACSGLAMSCPEHTQTAADGTCYIIIGDESYCVSQCWVDPTIVGGTQCQCGATCQPYGGPDGEGNLRGICTYE
jgi:hypothetical protein